MLISCLMPTHNRRRFVPGAIRCFLEQTWEARELVIFDDGDDPIADIVPDDPRIRYLFSRVPMSMREKRQATYDAAQGDLLAFWDDDDWHGPARLERQALTIRDSGKTACLLNPIIFRDETTGRTWRFDAPRGHAVGTLVFTRSYYDLVPGGFLEPDVTFSDQRFLRDRPRSEIVRVDGKDLYVAVRHGGNSTGCTFVPGGPWTEVHPEKSPATA